MKSNEHYRDRNTLLYYCISIYYIQNPKFTNFPQNSIFIPDSGYTQKDLADAKSFFRVSLGRVCFMKRETWRSFVGLLHAVYCVKMSKVGHGGRMVLLMRYL